MGLDSDDRNLDSDDDKLQLNKSITLTGDGKIRTIKLQLKDSDGREASIISAYRNDNGEYNLSHRKTADKYKARGLATDLLRQMEDVIREHSGGEQSVIFLESNQSSVFVWLEKNGYTFKGGKPDFSKEPININNDGDIWYENRFRLEKKI